MRTEEQLRGVNLLGSDRSPFPANYAPEVLESFVNMHPDNEYLVTFHCPEFTTLCPAKPAGLRYYCHLLYSAREDGREQVVEVVSGFIPQPWRFS